MSTTQKIIKNLALAFAFFLIITIFGTIALVFNIIGNIFFNPNNILDNPKIIDISKEIEYFDIEISSTDLEIIASKDYKIETTSSNLKIKEKNNKIIIEEKQKSLFQAGEVAKTIIYIPKEKIIKDLKLETGAGVLNIEELTINNLDLELGAGKVNIDNLKVLKETNISGGTGQVNIINSELSNTDLELGVGELNLNTKLLGRSSIESGVGTSNIKLIGNKEDYKIKVSKGIGKIKVNKKDISNSTTYGEGNNIITIDGGIGNINISFNN